MCKLMLLTGIQDSALAAEFMRRMAVPMSKSNPHGIGYTGVKPDGSIFSQRWLNNDDFMSLDNVMTAEDLVTLKAKVEELEPFRKKLPVGALNIPMDLNYGQYGDVDLSEVKTLTMHTRWATCGREFANTHPFIDQDVSLVHNGMISNATRLNVNKISTCDSEAALQTYLTEGVLNDSSKAKAWLDRLFGSWAFGILGRNTSGNRILDVVRGSSNLYYIEAGPLGKMFVTNDDDARGVLKDMNIEITGGGSMIPQDSMYRFDALTGDLIEEIDVKPVRNYSHGYGHGSSYQHGTGGTTSSTQSSSSQSSRMSKKDKEYNEAIIKDAMGQAGFPDLFNHKDGWDHAKVKKYTHDTKEPLLDRLYIFDDVFDKDYAAEYEALPDALKEMVKDVDMMEGFKAARDFIDDIVDNDIANYG